MKKNFRRALRLLPLACALLLVTPPASAQQRAEPTVSIVEIVGGIDSSYAQFLKGELTRAAREGDVAVVIRIDSSGTVEANAAELVRAVADSPVPVGTWVGPRGAHVSGAATSIWAAGDVRMAATGTDVDGEQPAAIGGAGTRSARPTVTADATPGTIVEAIRTLDGRTVNGKRVAIDSTTAHIRFAKPGPVIAVRHALATNPTLVYLLLLTGLATIVFELFQPGFGPAGYAGGLLVALAAYGLIALPTSPIGLALVLLGVGGMAYDVRRDTLTLATGLGAAVLGAGSWFLVTTNGPALRPALWAILTGVAGSLLFYGIVMTVVLRALRGQSANLGKALIGRSGEVKSVLNPQGHVLVEGALWRARAIEWDGPVAAGTPVVVTGVDEEALVLDVEPVSGKG